MGKGLTKLSKMVGYSLLSGFVSMQMALASTGGSPGGSAASTALQTLAQYSKPVIEGIAIILLVVGIFAAAFEFFKRSLGWAIGLFVGSTVLFAVLWALAPEVSSVLQQIANTVSVSG